MLSRICQCTTAVEVTLTRGNFRTLSVEDVSTLFTFGVDEESCEVKRHRTRPILRTVEDPVVSRRYGLVLP